MERRSFLKLCAAAPLVAAVPSLAFAEIDEPLKAGVRHIGNVRETITDDFRHGQYIVQYDVLCGTRKGSTIVLDKQYGVDFAVKDLSELPRIKNKALKALYDGMKEDKVDFTTIMPFDFALGNKIMVDGKAYKLG